MHNIYPKAIINSMFICQSLFLFLYTVHRNALYYSLYWRIFKSKNIHMILFFLFPSNRYSANCVYSLSGKINDSIWRNLSSLNRFERNFSNNSRRKNNMLIRFVLLMNIKAENKKILTINYNTSEDDLE
jgi:hypothetical protein